MKATIDNYLATEYMSLPLTGRALNEVQLNSWSVFVPEDNEIQQVAALLAEISSLPRTVSALTAHAGKLAKVASSFQHQAFRLMESAEQDQVAGFVALIDVPLFFLPFIREALKDETINIGYEISEGVFVRE